MRSHSYNSNKVAFHNRRNIEVLASTVQNIALPISVIMRVENVNRDTFMRLSTAIFERL